jgi:predicted nucleic acid-binding protein
LPDVLAALDPGETAVIMLALEQGLRQVLMDERKGRRVAAAAGLSVSGTVGVILRAKRNGHVRAVRPLLRGLRDTGLWLADDLIERTVREAGE